MRKYAVFTLFFAFITFFYYQKIGSFGCFDDCFNYTGGYFLLKGKQIYSEFFYNHAPFMAYISFLIQKFTNPESIYQLILYHRLFTYLFSFIMGIFLIFRFRWSALGFLLVFETTKFYLFGDRFLGESFAVYPIIYMVGVAILKLQKIKPKKYDYILFGVFIWFVASTREPYTLVAFFAYFVLLWGREEARIKVLSGLLFAALSALTLTLLPLKDFYFNVFTLNQGRTQEELISNGGTLISLVKSFFYPIYSVFEGEKNLLRVIVIGLDIVFLDIVFNLFKKKLFLQFFVIFLILGLANIRVIYPGVMYFQAFHLLIWYGLMIFVIFLSISFWVKKEPKFYVLIFIIFLITLYSMFSNESFIKPADKITEFNNSYANEFAYGSAIKSLSKPSDSLFVEERDDLIYFVSDLPSSYKYSWYTSFMPLVPKYRKARVLMFEKSPPDFYYDACLKSKRSRLPESIINIYARLKLNGNSSCLLVKKTKLPNISKEQADSIKHLGFSLN